MGRDNPEDWGTDPIEDIKKGRLSESWDNNGRGYNNGGEDWRSNEQKIRDWHRRGQQERQWQNDRR